MSTYYEDPAHVDAYIKKCEGYDCAFLFERLQQHLPPGKSVLELGVGPGNDLAHLVQHYDVTGSDLSAEFLKRCRIRFPLVKFLQLDAVTLETTQTFDCIYSNKVLHLLGTEELRASCQRQTQKLRDGGLFAHTFWIGDGRTEEIKGMSYIYHQKDALLSLIGETFDVIDTLQYGEFEDDDSLFVIATKRDGIGLVTG